MTSLPARVVGLSSKGVVRKGMDADLVAFDPLGVGAQSTFEQPRCFPVGVDHVIVNGEFIVRDGKTTGAMPASPSEPTMSPREICHRDAQLFVTAPNIGDVMEEAYTDDAPAGIGPYSQAIKDETHVFVSGQGPVDPDSGDIVSDEIQEQTVQTLKNVGAILEAAGSSLDSVVKATVFVTNMDDYDDMNEVYGKYMSAPFPARSAVQVADLPINISVEIEIIAEH